MSFILQTAARQLPVAIVDLAETSTAAHEAKANAGSYEHAWSSGQSSSSTLRAQHTGLRVYHGFRKPG
jgi:hypothetical protein